MYKYIIKVLKKTHTHTQNDEQNIKKLEKPAQELMLFDFRRDPSNNSNK